MIIFKDNQVDFPLYVIKDFLPDPYSHRQVLLNAEISNVKGFFTGDNLIVSEDFLQSTYKSVLETAFYILNDYVWVPFLSTVDQNTDFEWQAIQFRRQEDENHKSILAAHHDRLEIFDFDSVGRPIFAPYTFWSFIFSTTPEEKSAKLCFSENRKGERFSKIEPYKKHCQQEMTNFDEWKTYKEVDYEYNSAIMFPAHFWHSVVNIKCSKENPRTIFASWFYSGYNHKYNHSGISQLT